MPTVHVSVQMGQLVPQLLSALIAKLDSCQRSPVITGLLSVVCQLVHMDATKTVDLLAGIPAPGLLGAVHNHWLQFTYIHTPACMRVWFQDGVKLVTHKLVQLECSCWYPPALSVQKQDCLHAALPRPVARESVCGRKHIPVQACCV